MSARSDAVGDHDSNHVELVARDALRNVVVGISVSDSVDLLRLGLTQQHCEMAVAELARAIFLAGGTLVYGGRLVPRSGFTEILLDELRQYREDRDALVLCVPESEHRHLGNDEMQRIAQDLSASVELVCLDTNGEPVSITNRNDGPVPTDAARALSAMRQHITARCDARVLVGGKLSGYHGELPGVVEEAVLSLDAAQPLYVAGGFGGAAAAVADILGRSTPSWFPADFPGGGAENQESLARVADAAVNSPPVADGLTEAQRQQLAMTHRPGDIASLVVLGLGRGAADGR